MYLWNHDKIYRKKAPKKVRETKTRDKDQSPGKQTAQIFVAGHKEEREPLTTIESSTSCMKHIN